MRFIVGQLGAITVEAAEIRAKSKRRVSNYPTVMDPGFQRLEGDIVEADVIDAHHVRARVLIADKVTAHKFERLRGKLAWAPDGGGEAVRNRCTALPVFGPAPSSDCGH